MNEKVESTSLLLSYQNESIKEIKASLDTNFCNMLNISSIINNHVIYKNRRINSIDSKFALFFPNTKDGNTEIYSCLLCLARGVKAIALVGRQPNFIFIPCFLIMFSNK